jgi:LuxR family maltose regulon positive regulatory protein
MAERAHPPDNLSQPGGGVPDPSILQIRCFGRFEVYRQGAVVQHWRRDHARALLKYLVVQGRPVARESLLDMFWTGVDPVVSGRSLRVVLHALRQAVGTWGTAARQDYVMAAGDQLLLNPLAPVWVDTRAFMQHLHNADAFERRSDPTAAAGEYAQAAAIYRDDYLIEDLAEQWALLRREQFKDRYLVVLARLADHELESGDMVACIAHCHKLLDQDEGREDVYQRLMYCHTLLGQRSRALYWYRRCEAALHAELGLGAGERTRLLYEHIASSSDAMPSVEWLIPRRVLVPTAEPSEDG